MFVSEMLKIFDHPVQGREAGGRLFTCSQNSGSVAEFAVEFRILAAESGWDETASRAAFIRCLSEEVKDEFSSER